MTHRRNLGDLAPPDTDPAKVALIDLALMDLTPGEPRAYTYAAIDRMARSVAAYLVQRGFARGTRIGIVALNRAEHVATYFGIMRAGLVAVPISTRLPADTIAYILDDADVALVFTDAACAGQIPSHIATISFDDPGAAGFAALLTDAPFATRDVQPDDLAQQLYTSGSTGRPKGVPLSHESQLWALRARAGAPGAADERYIVAAPLFHMNGLVSTKGAFFNGASMVLLPGFTARSFIEAAAAHGVTAITSVPTMMARVLKETETLARLDLSGIRRVTMGSSPLTLSLWQRVQETFPGAVLFNSYGTTEAGPAVFGQHPDGKPIPPLSSGYPLPGSEMRLVDGPNADEGVLLMRNPSLMRGYHKLPAQTVKALRDGWYVSGDVFRRDADGFYYFVGRADDMFVCSGENIYPGEVEKMLDRHPDIHQSAVVPLPDEERGQIPVAFIVPRGEATLRYDVVKAFAIANAPAFQHPRRVQFVAELPLAGTNKVDRRRLIETAARNEAAGTWSA
jgi:long-chain acyl-CoA synthetase